MENASNKIKFDVHLSRQISEGYIVGIEADSVEDAKRTAGEILRDFIVDIERKELNRKMAPVSIGEYRGAILSDGEDLQIDVECADFERSRFDVSQLRDLIKNNSNG